MPVTYSKIIQVCSSGVLTGEQIIRAMISHLQCELKIETGETMPVIKSAMNHLFLNEKQV